MSKLTITITNDAGATMGQYEIGGLDSPTEGEEKRRTVYLLNQIRVAAEVHKYYQDFAEPPRLYQTSSSSTIDFDDPTKDLRGENVNALWLEIANLLRGARLNFAASRIVKKIEMEYIEATPEGRNTRYYLHFDKMERFYLAVFELARIEDLVVRLLFEFFDDRFIAVDKTKKDWEKRLTWDAMKDALNKRGKPDREPHPRVEAMQDGDYEILMKLIRCYKTQQVLALTDFRDRRTHRVTPSVDYPELGAVLSTAETSGEAIIIPVSVMRSKPEYEFLQLYETAKTVYEQLSEMLLGLNRVIHA
jgi:hypothetical protein